MTRQDLLDVCKDNNVTGICVEQFASLRFLVQSEEMAQRLEDILYNIKPITISHTIQLACVETDKMIFASDVVEYIKPVAPQIGGFIKKSSLNKDGVRVIEEFDLRHISIKP